MQIYLF